MSGLRETYAQVADLVRRKGAGRLLRGERLDPFEQPVQWHIWNDGRTTLSQIALVKGGRMEWMEGPALAPKDVHASSGIQAAVEAVCQACRQRPENVGIVYHCAEEFLLNNAKRGPIDPMDPQTLIRFEPAKVLDEPIGSLADSHTWIYLPMASGPPAPRLPKLQWQEPVKGP